MPEKPEVRRVPIDLEGKQFMIFKNTTRDEIESFKDILKEWLENQDPIMLLWADKDFEIEVVKIDRGEAE